MCHLRFRQKLARTELETFIQGLKMAAAEQLMRRAVDIFERSYGVNHPNVATALNNLGLLLHTTGRLTEAGPLMHRVVCIFFDFGRETGHEHPHLRIVVGNYTSLLMQAGLSQVQAQARIDELARQCGVQFRRR